MSHFSDWIGTLVYSLDANVDEKTKNQIMEDCGRACARRRAVRKVKDLKSKVDDLDKLLEEVNRLHFWTDSLHREGNTIYAVYNNCYCSLVKDSKDKLSPSFCLCSRGWVKELMEIIVGKPVDVEIEKTIRRGDAFCKFSVYF